METIRSPAFAGEKAVVDFPAMKSGIGVSLSASMLVPKGIFSQAEIPSSLLFKMLIRRFDIVNHPPYVQCVEATRSRSTGTNTPYMRHKASVSGTFAGEAKLDPRTGLMAGSVDATNIEITYSRNFGFRVNN
jgi:hypothetical protein